jgi:hypothetical protein
MPEDTRATQLLEAFEAVELDLAVLYDDLDSLSDDQDDGRFLRAVNHLAETSDAITAARNAFKDALAIGEPR